MKYKLSDVLQSLDSNTQSDEIGNKYKAVSQMYCIYSVPMIVQQNNIMSLADNNNIDKLSHAIFNIDIDDEINDKSLLFNEIIEICDRESLVKYSDNISRISITDSTRINIRNLYIGIQSNLPIVLMGEIGMGKTVLLHLLAKALKQYDTIIEININELTDSKSLIGSYICTDVPGEFIWQNGVLTQAVIQGYWFVVEDIDTMSLDVIATLSGLIEQRKLFIPSLGKEISAHSNFRLIATKSVHSSGEKTIHYNLANLRHFSECFHVIVMNEPDIKELREIIELNYNCIPNFIIDKLINIYVKFNTNVIDSQYYNHHIKKFSIRDLIKVSNRINLFLSNNAVSKSSIRLTEDQTISCLKEVIDVFLSSISDRKLTLDIILIISTDWGITNDTVTAMIINSVPQIHESVLSQTQGHIAIGRSLLSYNRNFVVNAIESNSDEYAYTKYTLRLLEQISICIACNENVLLVGETGTGKTSCIQQLAYKLNKQLVVQNLSLSTDTTDLFGGYRPMTIKLMLHPVYELFLNLFRETFSSEKNSDYTYIVIQMYNKSEWVKLLKAFQKAYNYALKKLDKSDKAPIIKDRLISKWSHFNDKIIKLEKNLPRIIKGFCFSFVNGLLVTAIQTGQWILLDEINLASPDTLQGLTSVLDGQSITLTEDGSITTLKKHPDFRLFAAMNPPTDVGKRELSPYLRNRFSEIYVDEMTDPSDLQSTVTKYLVDIADPPIDKIVDTYIKCRSLAMADLIDGANQRPRYTMRSLSRCLKASKKFLSLGFRPLDRVFFEAFVLNFYTMLMPGYSRDRMMSFLRETFNIKLNLKEIYMSPARPGGKHSSPDDWVLIKPFWLSSGPFDKKDWAIKNQDGVTRFVMTKTIESYIRDITSAIAVSISPILLQGPTSVGKTTMIEYLAARTGHKCIRINNHEHTDIQEYIGSYVSNSTGQLEFKDGLLVQALRNGYWIILDELNLAPSDVLEALNRLLDDNKELYVPETNELIKPCKEFQLFATQNPPGLYGGRKPLSRAFRNRFIEIVIDDLPPDEVEEILTHTCNLPKSYSSILVAVMKDLSIHRNDSTIFQGKHGLVTLRDLIKWGRRGINSKQDIYDHGYMILAEKLRSEKDKHDVLTILQRACNIFTDPQLLYVNVSSDLAKIQNKFRDKVTSDKIEGISGIAITSSIKRIWRLTTSCLANNEPVLLIGETGTGKTTVCQLYGFLHNKPVHILNCHQSTEASDIIGGLRPNRSRDFTLNELFRKINNFFETINISNIQSSNVKQFLNFNFLNDKNLFNINSVQHFASQLQLFNKQIDNSIIDKDDVISDSQIFKKMKLLKSDIKEHFTPNSESQILSNIVSVLIEEIGIYIARYHSMFEWVDGPLVTAMKLGHIFVLDEINLADDAIIERINSVLESNRTITLAEKGGQSMEKLTAHPDFKILATMNPGGDYGKRELSPALRSRFSEIYIPEFSYTELEYEDMRLVIGEILHFDSIDVTISSNPVTNIIIDIMRYMHELTSDMKINNINISVRDVLAWAKFVNYWITIINVTELSDIDIYLAIGHGMHMIILDGLGIGMSVSRDIIHVIKFNIFNKFTSLIPLKLRQIVANKLSNFDEILIPKYTDKKFILSDLGIDIGSEKIQSTYPQNYELSISTSINFYRIIRASQIHRPILLEGPPGVGKTSLISTLASLSGHRLIRINLSEHTELSDLLGTDLPSDNSDESDLSIDNSNKFVWKDGVFLQAMKSGDWILLDELNLASQSVLEGLNACLDHREEIYIPDIDQTVHRHANFRIFCAQNPMAQGGGRKGLPKSFLSRFSKVYVESIGFEDLIFISSNLFEKLFRKKFTNQNGTEFLYTELKSQISSVVKFVDDLKNVQLKSGSIEFNLRDIIRWMELILQLSSNVNVIISNDLNQRTSMYLSNKIGKTLEDTIKSFVRDIIGETCYYLFILRMRNNDDKELIYLKFSHFFSFDISTDNFPMKIEPCHSNSQSNILYGSVLLNCHVDPVIKKDFQILNYEKISNHKILEAVYLSISLNFPVLLVGSYGLGKRDIVRELARCTGNNLIEYSMSSSIESTELLGSFEQVNIHRYLSDGLDLINEVVIYLSNTCINKITECPNTMVEQTRNISGQYEIIRDLSNEIFISPYNILSKSKHIFSLIESLVSLIQAILSLLRNNKYLRKLSDAIASISKCRRIINKSDSINEMFEWVDGIIVKAATNGDWIILDNINLCSANILDRLNSLLESNGTILLTECKGSYRYITPHPNFRIFLIMNPIYGEISQAMRNRCIELYFPESNSFTEAINNFQSVIRLGLIENTKIIKHQSNRVFIRQSKLILLDDFTSRESSILQSLQRIKPYLTDSIFASLTVLSVLCNSNNEFEFESGQLSWIQLIINNYSNSIIGSTNFLQTLIQSIQNNFFENSTIENKIINTIFFLVNLSYNHKKISVSDNLTLHLIKNYLEKLSPSIFNKFVCIYKSFESTINSYGVIFNLTIKAKHLLENHLSSPHALIKATAYLNNIFDCKDYYTDFSDFIDYLLFSTLISDRSKLLHEEASITNGNIGHSNQNLYSLSLALLHGQTAALSTEHKALIFIYTFLDKMDKSIVDISHYVSRNKASWFELSIIIRHLVIFRDMLASLLINNQISENIPWQKVIVIVKWIKKLSKKQETNIGRSENESCNKIFVNISKYVDSFDRCLSELWYSESDSLLDGSIGLCVNKLRLWKEAGHAIILKNNEYSALYHNALTLLAWMTNNRTIVHPSITETNINSNISETLLNLCSKNCTNFDSIIECIGILSTIYWIDCGEIEEKVQLSAKAVNISEIVDKFQTKLLADPSLSTSNNKLVTSEFNYEDYYSCIQAEYTIVSKLEKIVNYTSKLLNKHLYYFHKLASVLPSIEEIQDWSTVKHNCVDVINLSTRYSLFELSFLREVQSLLWIIDSSDNPISVNWSHLYSLARNILPTLNMNYYKMITRNSYSLPAHNGSNYKQNDVITVNDTLSMFGTIHKFKLVRFCNTLNLTDIHLIINSFKLGELVYKQSSPALETSLLNFNSQQKTLYQVFRQIISQSSERKEDTSDFRMFYLILNIIVSCRDFYNNAMTEQICNAINLNRKESIRDLRDLFDAILKYDLSNNMKNNFVRDVFTNYLIPVMTLIKSEEYSSNLINQGEVQVFVGLAFISLFIPTLPIDPATKPQSKIELYSIAQTQFRDLAECQIITNILRDGSLTNHQLVGYSVIMEDFTKRSEDLAVKAINRSMSNISFNEIYNELKEIYNFYISENRLLVFVAQIKGFLYQDNKSNSRDGKTLDDLCREESSLQNSLHTIVDRLSSYIEYKDIVTSVRHMLLLIADGLRTIVSIVKADSLEKRRNISNGCLNTFQYPLPLYFNVSSIELVHSQSLQCLKNLQQYGKVMTERFENISLRNTNKFPYTNVLNRLVTLSTLSRFEYLISTNSISLSNKSNNRFSPVFEFINETLIKFSEEYSAILEKQKEKELQEQTMIKQRNVAPLGISEQDEEDKELKSNFPDYISIFDNMSISNESNDLRSEFIEFDVKSSNAKDDISMLDIYDDGLVEELVTCHSRLIFIFFINAMKERGLIWSNETLSKSNLNIKLSDRTKFYKNMLQHDITLCKSTDSCLASILSNNNFDDLSNFNLSMISHILSNTTLDQSVTKLDNGSSNIIKPLNIANKSHLYNDIDRDLVLLTKSPSGRIDEINPIDFHRESSCNNIPMILPVIPVLKNLLKQIDSHLIIYPENEILNLIKKIVQMILSFHVTSPLAKVLTAITLLFSKLNEWESFSSRNLSLYVHIEQLKKLILMYRQHELNSWNYLLRCKENVYNIQAMKQWFFLISIVHRYQTNPGKLTKSNNRIPIWLSSGHNGERNDVNLIDDTLFHLIDDFIRSSKIGEYYMRLHLLRLFSIIMMYQRNANHPTGDLSTILISIWMYYSSFVPYIRSFQNSLKDPIFQRLIDEIKISKWDNMSVYSIIDHSNKIHRKLTKIIKDYGANVLDIPIEKVIQDEINSYHNVDDSDKSSINKIPDNSSMFSLLFNLSKISMDDCNHDNAISNLDPKDQKLKVKKTNTASSEKSIKNSTEIKLLEFPRIYLTNDVSLITSSSKLHRIPTLFAKIQSYISEYMVPNISDDEDLVYENKLLFGRWGNNLVENLSHEIFYRINTLRSEGSPKPIKHRAMNDLFETLKYQGINHFRSQIPSQLRDFPTLLSSISPPLSAELLGDLTWDNSLPLTSFNKGENYFYRNMTELSQLRNQSYLYISSDISQRESQLMIGISESLFLESVRLRSILSEQFENYKELSKQIEILASFVESNANNNKEIDDFISTKCSIILDSLLFMSSLLETYKKSNNEDLLESKPLVGLISTTKLTTILNVLTDLTNKFYSFTSKDRKDDLDTLLGYKSNFNPAKTIDLKSFNELLQKTLDSISNESVDLNAIFGSDFIQRFINQLTDSLSIHKSSNLTFSLDEMFDNTTIENSVEHIVDACLISIQHLTRIFKIMTRSNDGCSYTNCFNQLLENTNDLEDFKLADCYKYLYGLIGGLNTVQIISSIKLFMNIFDNLSKNKLSKYLSLCNYVLPMVTQIKQTINILIDETSFLYKCTGKLLYINLRIYRTLLSHGFCLSASEEEGKSSKDDSNGQKIQDNLDGTGMGEGEGLTDVSNQITNEEQILGQKESPFDNKEDTSEPNEKKDVPKEKEKPDSGVEMSQDFQGDMVDLPEDSNSEEAEDQDDNEVDRDDLDRELGEADLNDIVDEKQWNSDEESDVEDNAEGNQKDKFEKNSKMSGKELDEIRTKEADEEEENDESNNNKDDGNNSANENAANDDGLNYDSDSDQINELKDDDNMEKPYDQRPKDNDNHSDGDDNDLDHEKNEEVGLENGDPVEEQNNDVNTDALPDIMDIDNDNIDENVDDDVNSDKDDNVDIDEDDQRPDDTKTNDQPSGVQEQLDEKKDDNDLRENLNKNEANPKTNNKKKAGPITYGVNVQGSSEQVLGTESSVQRTGDEPTDSSENDINPSESQENSEITGGEGDDGRNNSSGNSGGQDKGSKPDDININTSNNEKTSRDNLNKSYESTPLPNPFREKGDINKIWHRRLNVSNDVNINEVEDNQDDAITEDIKLYDNSTNRQFEYVTNETDTSDMQVLANEPNAEAINTSYENCIDTEIDQEEIIDSSEFVDKVKDKEVKSDIQRKRKYPDSSEPLNDLSEELSAKSFSEEQVNKSPKLQEINDDLTIDYSNISINEVIHSDRNFRENNECDNFLDDGFGDNADSHINDLSLPIATNLWQKNRKLTESASARLCEQLRLILEPTLTTRLQGDYRSGKRINMRKVITYIASGYRKDKIWLRRTKPAKRDYHVMLMIDNTKSMAAAGSLALSSLSTLANALTRLESGELCVCSFSDSLQVVHPFNKPFNDLAGIDMFTKFTFLSERTLLAKSLSMAGKVFEANRGNNENRKCMRLLFVVSDARIDSDNRNNLKHVIRQLFEINVLLVLLIVDNNHDSRDSIFNTKTVSFIDNMIISTNYLDDFPFPYYVTVQQIERLPELLSSALKQWFEIIQTNEK